MENYIVSARKYRPATFSSVVGQKALTATLKNAIATDRLAHAYLFCGSRGVGKTSCARIFAKTINCEHRTPDGDPCNECDSCRAFNENRSLNIIELDAASNNGVDDIRALVEQVQVPPTNGRYRVFIIDEVHMLSAAAFNAFLKTLEEPPSYVIFILATTEKHKIIPTILSRCQIYDFNRITIADMTDHLEYVASQEGITTERSALGVIAAKADGAMRDALSIFDQVAASSRGNITYRSTIENLNVLDAAYYSRLVDAFIACDVPQALLIYKEIRDRGFDSHFFVNGLAAYVRDLMVARNPQTVSLLDTDDETRDTMAAQSARCNPEFYYQAMSLCNDADLNYRLAANKTFLVELLLIKLCQLLSPSPIFSGDGEGQLKKIEPAAGAAQPATPAPVKTPVTPAADPASGTRQTAAAQPRRQTADKQQPPAAAPSGSVPPPPAPERPQMPRRNIPLRTTRINVPDPAAEQAATVTATATARTARTDNYTDADIQRAWDNFMAARPTEHILVNTMRASRPQLSATPHTFTVTVENHVQHEMLGAVMPELLTAVRDAASNDSITFVIEENEGAGSPRTWNEREILAYLSENHPTIKSFIHDLKLTLT